MSEQLASEPENSCQVASPPEFEGEAGGEKASCTETPSKPKRKVQQLKPCYFQAVNVGCGHRQVEYLPSGDSYTASVSEDAAKRLSVTIFQVIAGTEPDPK